MTKQFIIFGLLLLICNSLARPDTRNPNSEYELISGGPQVVAPKPTIVTITTQKPFVFNSPPPVDPNSKTFAYDPKTGSWTAVKRTDPQPAEDTLLWNQSNDKWLTQIARV